MILFCVSCLLLTLLICTFIYRLPEEENLYICLAYFFLKRGGGGGLFRSLQTYFNHYLACEQALRSRMGRKESGKRKVEVGEGEKVAKRGRGGEPVDKAL